MKVGVVIRNMGPQAVDRDDQQREPEQRKPQVDQEMQLHAEKGLKGESPEIHEYRDA